MRKEDKNPYMGKMPMEWGLIYLLDPPLISLEVGGSEINNEPLPK